MATGSPSVAIFLPLSTIRYSMENDPARYNGSLVRPF
jgi:hypothetical protein